MAKVIRTARLGDAVITLGKDEGSLHLSAEELEADEGHLDLAGLIVARMEQVRAEVVAEWEESLRQEHETMRSAADRQLRETEERHSAELERVNADRYAEGFNAGVESKVAEVAEAVNRFDTLHGSLEAERSQVLLEAETTVVDLSVAIARQIVGAAAETDPRVLIGVIRAALEHLRERSHLTIMVHPEDQQLARRFVTHWVRKVDEDAVLRVKVSDHVERGGCMIEGTEENVDARIKEQIQALHDVLRVSVEDDIEAIRETQLENEAEDVQAPETGIQSEGTDELIDGHAPDSADETATAEDVGGEPAADADGGGD